MSKQYMFRAKKMLADGIPGEWVYGSNLWSGQLERPHTTIINNTSVVGDTLGQYIGIRDTSTPAKEIYDGDIIEGKSGMRHLVKYEEDLAAFVAYLLPRDEDLTPCHITKKWVVEFGKKVVGNVFDNPELLKKEV